MLALAEIFLSALTRALFSTETGKTARTLLKWVFLALPIFLCYIILQIGISYFKGGFLMSSLIMFLFFLPIVIVGWVFLLKNLQKRGRMLIDRQNSLNRRKKTFGSSENF